MKTDHTLSRREEREQKQQEELVFSVLNRATAAITTTLAVYLAWALMLGLTA
tara:strand:+ start:1562 stop:1717 length:156 start_codon:yes stop_codon:yes gene_type:complete